MTYSLVWNSLYIFIGFISLIIARYLIHVIHVRHTLRKIPGPPSSSLLWGEEWELYHDAPGSHYLKWHQEFGKVVKFSGAFGVRIFAYSCVEHKHLSKKKQHQVLSITDPRAITFIVGSEGIYDFPKPHGVRAWFKATLGEGIIWVEGKSREGFLP